MHSLIKAEWGNSEKKMNEYAKMLIQTKREAKRHLSIFTGETDRQL